MANLTAKTIKVGMNFIHYFFRKIVFVRCLGFSVQERLGEANGFEYVGIQNFLCQFIHAFSKGFADE